MKLLCIAFALFALAACQHGGATPDSAAAADARFVLPGSFSEATTVDDLRALYGAENVNLTTEPDGAGGTDTLVLLFPDDPTRRAEVRFHYGALDQSLASITVTDPTSRWRGKHGVRIGMSFAELRAKNGRAFYLIGFDAAGRGEVRDMWDVGELDVTEGDRLYFEVDLRVREGAPDGAVPRSEGTTSSDDPFFPNLGEHVEVSGIRAKSSLDDEWSRAPLVRPSALTLRRP